MDDINIVYLKTDLNKEKLKDPILIVGLPGVGHVGKFVVDYLTNVLKASPIIEIYSKYFSPQVLINSDNTVSFLKNKICFVHTENNDLLFLIGDYQSNDSKGHYELCETYINIALEYRVNKIFTLGGYTNITLDKSLILGSVNDTSLIQQLKEYGVTFRNFEPIGGIVGVSGLLLSFAALKGIKAVCLMGITSGYIADPKCSKYLLNMLGKILNIEIKEDALNTQIEDIEKIIENIKEEKETKSLNKKEEDLIYFG